MKMAAKTGLRINTFIVDLTFKSQDPPLSMMKLHYIKEEKIIVYNVFDRKVFFFP